MELTKQESEQVKVWNRILFGSLVYDAVGRSFYDCRHTRTGETLEEPRHRDRRVKVRDTGHNVTMR
jgi:hypothetical protein